MNMKTNICGIGLCIAGLLAASSAQADVVLTFNENGPYTGNPYQVLTGGTGTIQYVNQALDNNGATSVGNGDHVPSGGDASTLAYLIPYEGPNANLNYGWVVVYAPGTSTPGVNDVNIVDLIHFDNSYGSGPSYLEYTGGPNSTIYGQIFYYSKEGTGNAANNWVTSTTLASVLGAGNTVGITEPSNGQITYDPAALGSPGYNTLFSTPTAAVPQYDFQFNSVVPEPSAILAGAMMLLPFGASTLRFLRKNRAA